MSRNARSGPPSRGLPVPSGQSRIIQGLLAAAVQHHQGGRFGAAEQAYRHILTLEPRNADALHLLGLIVHAQGFHEAGIEMLRRAIAINNKAVSFHANLGIMLRDGGHIDGALSSFRKALDLKRDAPEAHNNLGTALGQKGLLADAVRSFRRATVIAPGMFEAYNNLGSALRDMGELEDSVAALRRAMELKPDFADAHNNIGITLRELGRLQEAAANSRNALALRPDFPEAHINLALALLALGDFEAGWPAYEWRWKAHPMSEVARGFTQPQWKGEAAQGKTLLIHAEQGYGDTIQFCRYAALAAARGLRVIMEVPQPLVRLVSSAEGVSRVIALGDALPDFDLQCPMLSLPLALATTVATIPDSRAYLHAENGQIEHWRARLDDPGDQRPRVGLVWAGNAALSTDKRRSLDPARLAPFSALTGIRFFSLQKGRAEMPPPIPLTDYMADTEDFADTAALVANLDLVIAVDTAAAHLAAAVGRPVWLLDRYDTDWRWLRDRTDSPWYPTLRIYRQPQPGDWDAVIAAVARDLHSFQPGAENRR